MKTQPLGQYSIQVAPCHGLFWKLICLFIYWLNLHLLVKFKLFNSFHLQCLLSLYIIKKKKNSVKFVSIHELELRANPCIHGSLSSNNFRKSLFWQRKYHSSLSSNKFQNSLFWQRKYRNLNKVSLSNNFWWVHHIGWHHSLP